MLKYSICIFSICLSFYSFAQFSEDFSDGDFTNNPTWQGDLNTFIVNSNFELQLNDTASGSAQILAPVAIGDTTTWEFLVRLEFAPSAGNRAKIYLSSTSADLSGALNGYFIEIGETGSNDALILYKQSGTTTTQLLRGTDGMMASDPALARIKITRSNLGDWEVYADYAGGTAFILEGTASDNTFPIGSYFGFHCVYTSTRKDKFFFDDIYIAPLFIDNTPPILQNLNVNSSTTIDLQFNEPLETTSATTTANYQLNGGIGNPNSAVLDAVDKSLVHLTFGSSMTNGQSYTVFTDNIKDENNNVSTAQSLNFTFQDIQPAAKWDILINEIMADPMPSVGLPNAEYVELYNQSTKNIQLENYTFTNGTTIATLPNFLLQPNQYVILCSDTDEANFTPFGEVISFATMPSLVNNGDDLVLSDANNTIIHEVNYQSSWYQDGTKDDGGWSLELKNPTLVCVGAENWQASNHILGGTPGTQNSIFTNVPDTQIPSITNLQVPDADSVWLVFDENIENSTANLISNYTIDNGIGNPSQAILQSDEQTILLVLNNLLQDNTTYTTTINGISDCSGNALTNETATFTFVETFSPNQYEILIHEFLADPNPSIGLPESEFVELYNNSEKPINLNELIFSSRNTEINLPSYVLLPNEYVILYDNIFSAYLQFGQALFVDGLPNLGNSEGLLMLKNQEDVIIHAVDYTSAWYGNSAKTNGGWTLELIDINQPCITDAQNWSASTALQGGTPGQPNSIQATQSPTKLDVLKAVAVTPFVIEVYFNKTVKQDLATDFSNYSIDNDLNVIDVVLQEPLYNRVLLSVDQLLQPQTIYEITIKNITDCVGNALGMFNKVNVGLSETIAANDIIINELLFNPFPDGNDFLELYNRSNKILDVSDLLIGNVADGFPNSIIEIDEPFLVFPKEYVILTSNILNIQQNYIVENPRHFLETSLPSYPDRNGGVVLLSNGILIDQLEYSADWHHTLLDDLNGVSLERINPEDSTQNANNWHSAAASVGYATPTYQNSQFLQNTNTTNDLITIPNQTFSPDGDGFEDFLLIEYQTPQNGYLASIQIYDSMGRLVKQLLNNELLGIEGSFKWDGVSDSGTKATLGIYVIFVELIHPNGDVQRIKKIGVLATKF